MNNAGASFTQGVGLRTAKGSADTMDAAYNLLLRSPWKISGFFIDELIKNKGMVRLY